MLESRYPSPFYRVSVKAIIVVNDKLLLSQDGTGKWEVPGGGWEHDETMETALTRELAEELHVIPEHIGDIQFAWRDYSDDRGVHYLRLAVPVSLISYNFTPDDGNLVAARFVSREEFKNLPFQSAEEGVRKYEDKIWSDE